MMVNKAKANNPVGISDLVFGTMSFGGEADEQESRALFDTCVKNDIFTFDCADVYSGGRAEEFLGRFIATDRESFTITTKGGLPLKTGGAGKEYLTSALDQSLTRLNTDYVDIYLVHIFDSKTPLEETLNALDEMVRQGKVRQIGVSNFSAWQVQKSLAISKELGLTPITYIQPMYSLIKRQCEVEILPQASSEGLGVLTYSPLGAGLLTGKYRTKDPSKVEGRLNRSDMYKARYRDNALSEVAEAFVGYCEENGLNPVAAALAWVKTNPAVTAPILGAKTVDQLLPQLECRTIGMDEKLRNEITALSIAPPSPTDRSETIS